jgi:hypothetical protein
MLLTCSAFLAASGLKGTDFSCAFGAGLGCALVVGGAGGIAEVTGSCCGIEEPVACA